MPSGQTDQGLTLLAVLAGSQASGSPHTQQRRLSISIRYPESPEWWRHRPGDGSFRSARLDRRFLFAVRTANTYGPESVGQERGEEVTA